MTNDALERLERAIEAVSSVVDPEIPAVSIADLGMVRTVRLAADGAVEVDLTPTYSGCPATDLIKQQVEAALAAAGLSGSRVNLVLSPAWTTDWITEEGRAALRRCGIAPPPRRGEAETPVACPHCGSEDTEELAPFGSTPCKALWRCRSCREPFHRFKCL
ncbi:MAG: phenylacetate-CoA oxygenase subunit PaaJ [Geminicoccaceae bacterium]|nr:phenylacetate-CoA oxygenase subunit PaaJ [Geminicoccaceae bacterium]MCS7268860.1 phenylacetate-CoA oxygenase subunit PaaJ [Geminicoccaceae bacterium]MCX7630385.1 phenylacetate-CoA oxygenase subunit PaaJ [Geminicoccaceae bacterium]MDW8125237.1 1,2-phenylacetyl-CoA epoxidase subunit PaaD [Geminicoccaceae bacterium]MDW8341010.1 1,2-phenylacetyl-CoA epoxidase subunit PaaD [Geminicoccaceae bacterium]